MGEWRDPMKDMPKDRAWVLFAPLPYALWTFIGIARLTSAGMRFVEVGRETYLGWPASEVLYWMPLPEPPEWAQPQSENKENDD